MGVYPEHWHPNRRMPLGAFLWRFATGGFMVLVLLVYPSIVGIGLLLVDHDEASMLLVASGLAWALLPGVLLGLCCWVSLPPMARLRPAWLWTRCVVCWLAWPALWLLGEFVIAFPVLLLVELVTSR